MGVHCSKCDADGEQASYCWVCKMIRAWKKKVYRRDKKIKELEAKLKAAREEARYMGVLGPL